MATNSRPSWPGIGATYFNTSEHIAQTSRAMSIPVSRGPKVDTYPARIEPMPPRNHCRIHQPRRQRLLDPRDPSLRRGATFRLDSSGPPPPSGGTQLMFCDGSLMSQVLQCTQFCALICSFGAPSSTPTNSYTARRAIPQPPDRGSGPSSARPPSPGPPASDAPADFPHDWCC